MAAKSKTKKKGFVLSWKQLVWGIAGFLLIVVIALAYAVKPAKVFPQTNGSVTVLRVASGETLEEVAGTMAEEGIVRFPKPASYVLSLLGARETLQSGAYVIPANTIPLKAFLQVARGDFGVEPIKVTIPEGATSYEIVKLLEGKFIAFDPQKFELLAKEREGYLFPDTYFFLPTATEEEILFLMEENFRTKVMTLLPMIQSSKKSLTQIIVIASLLEKEARTVESRRMIAGIINNRLKAEMPLQIDAVFGYINEVGTFSPKLSDLEVDSPYNTYKNKGLPAGPIANPGLDSILAAATPTESKYLYYLTGRDGTMRYAKTFDEHVKNRRKYLD